MTEDIHDQQPQTAPLDDRPSRARERVSARRRAKRSRRLRRLVTALGATGMVIAIATGIILVGPATLGGIIAASKAIVAAEEDLARSFRAWAARPAENGPVPADAIRPARAGGPAPAHGKDPRVSAAPADGVAGTAGAGRATALGARPPTPVFALAGGIRLRLPVETDQLTLVGYHQATNDLARTMRPVPFRTMSYGLPAMDGFVPGLPRSIDHLTMWRTGRSGPPTRAVDVGAPAGSAVLSPVDGVVTALRPYELYGVTPDVEIHVRPDGVRGLEVVLLHVDRTRVRRGDRVEAGRTRLADVRRLSRRLRMQLAYFSHDAGDHVHVQVNVPSARPAIQGIE